MYGINQGADQVRLTWRVIEANTGKVAASGAFNRVLADSAVQNLLNNSLNDSSADKIAQGLSQEVLAGMRRSRHHLQA